jgi:hypothetical protein
MPCDVQHLLRRRFRQQGEDVAGDAMLKWLDPAWNPDDIIRSYGRAPRDARLWLTSWPYLYLGRNSVRRAHREYADLVGLDDAPDRNADGRSRAELPARVARALDDVRRVDVISYSMLLDLLRDAFEARAWSSLLELSEASVTDKKYLAIFRYLAFFHEVLPGIEPREASVALRARRLAPGDPSDGAALEAARDELGQPGLTMTAYRELYRAGALRSLELLSAPDALGAESLSHLGTAFRRVLKID